MNRRLCKYIISDLHIGDRSWPDDFGDNREQVLIELIDRICGQKNQENELILLGDIIDFSIIDHLVVDEPGAVYRCIDRVAENYPKLFRHFKKFISKGNRIFYVHGNHDYPMRIHKAVNRFLYHILPRFHRDRYARLFASADYYLSSTLKIYAEHGNRYDQDNTHSDGAPPFGSIILDRFVRRWEHLCVPGNPPEHRYPLKESKRVRPYTSLIIYLNHLVNQSLLPEAVKDRMLKELIMLYAEANAPIPQFLLKILENAPPRIREAIVSARLRDSIPRLFVERAHQLFFGFSSDLSVKRKTTIADMLDLTFKPRVIVFGHSHILDQRDLGNGRWYLNTGTWMEILLVDQSGNSKKLMNYLPYVEINSDAEGNPLPISKSARTHLPIDIDSMRQEIAEIGFKL